MQNLKKITQLRKEIIEKNDRIMMLEDINGSQHRRINDYKEKIQLLEFKLEAIESKLEVIAEENIKLRKIKLQRATRSELQCKK